jgi:heptosyltransferase-3
MMRSNVALPERAKILVITLRRLGDVLLTTPLVRTLRRGWPDATLDVLVFSGTERILDGNPDIDHVLTVPERPAARENVLAVPDRSAANETLVSLRRLWRRYDLAISTQTGDRPTFLAALAGRRRAGLVPRQGGGAWWKRRVHDRPVVVEPDSHRITQLLRLASAFGLRPCTDIVCPQSSSAEAVTPPAPYAVLHASPMYRFRRWTSAGWRELARALAGRGLAVVATGSPHPKEKSYLDGVWDLADRSVLRLDGRLDWGQLTKLLRGAAVYVGPDTSMTHLAAGAGCPTVALFGPTSPRLIGPWPVGGLDEPWAHAGTVQHRGNVWIVQNPLPCLPCEKAGCERHLDSYSQCLDELPVGQVLAAVDQALAARKTVALARPA